MRRKLAPSRTAAQEAIAAGSVIVAGITDPKPATLVAADTPIHLRAPARTFVGRGGDKLAGALDRFPVEVEGRRAADVGASTGGFTDVLLRRGARRVVAIDVGYGQLDWSLRSRDEVEVVDRTNIRYVDPDDIGAPFDVVVADLSFISLCTVAESLSDLVADRSDLVLLVKPQFEVGRDSVGKGGIVREPGLHVEALQKVAGCLDAVGLGVCGVTPSPISGTDGNREFFVWVRPGPRSVSDEALEWAVREGEAE